VDTLVFKGVIAQAEGDLARAAALLAPLHPDADDVSALGFNNGELRFFLGWAQEVGGEHAAAEESWQQARSELESFLKVA